MKVEGNRNIVLNLYKQNTLKLSNSNEIKNSDKIELSKLGKEISKYIEDSSCCNISNRVEEIKEKIKNGTYKVNEEELAKSILDEIKRGI